MKEIEYIQVGDYQLPNLKVEEMHLNRFGRAKLDYLKKHDYGLYFKLLTKNELKDYLLKVQKEADDLYDRLVEEYKVKWNVTEELKKTKPNFCELSDTKQEEKKKKCKINGGENDRS